jgi:hypothetical protein
MGLITWLGQYRHWSRAGYPHLPARKSPDLVSYPDSSNNPFLDFSEFESECEKRVATVLLESGDFRSAGCGSPARDLHLRRFCRALAHPYGGL